ncbi:MAG: NFYB/HAP3 family transcription factor subunit [Nanoarchaeota archaeon]|nr:NFYB/HAP3 family transcription factor subunit [Nanoarchaeota archaeon]
MGKKIKSDNALMIIRNQKGFCHAKNQKRFFIIKRNNLALLLKKHGIKRLNKNALKMIEKKLEEKAEIMAELIARKLMLEGRKTLKEEDISSLDKPAEKRVFEI